MYKIKQSKLEVKQHLKTKKFTTFLHNSNDILQ